MPNDTAKCASCGADHSTMQTLEKIGQTAGKFADKAKNITVDVSESDDVTFNISGKKLRISLVIMIISVVLIALLFLPIINIKDVNITLSGINMIFGKTYEYNSYGWFGTSSISQEKLPGNFVEIFLMVIPAIIFIGVLLRNNPHIKKYLKGKTLFLAFILSVLGLFLFSTCATTKNLTDLADYFTLKFSFAYYMSIILYVLNILVCLGGFLISKRIITIFAEEKSTDEQQIIDSI